jgi:hypothetical protein
VLWAPSLTSDSRPSRTTRKSYGPRVPDRTMVAKFDRVLLCWFRNGPASLRKAMKTAGRENPNHWAKVSSNRAPGAADQNRSCSIKWAAKQEKVRPLRGCFFLTFLFIELIRRFVASMSQSEPNRSFELLSATAALILQFFLRLYTL